MKSARLLLLSLTTAVCIFAASAAAQTAPPAKTPAKAPAAKPRPKKKARKPRKPNWRKIEAGIQARNAARQDKGGRVSVRLTSPDAGINRNTPPSAVADGSTHSRCVLWGRYVYRIDLVAALPVTQINFICSDGQGEASPKDVEIRLSDGTVIAKTLEVRRPERRRRDQVPRQSVDVDKTVEWIEVAVLSSHEGAVNPKTGKARHWGGLGEIEVLTSADLAAWLVVPDYNPDTPVYVEGGSPRNDYSNVTVTLPATIPLGRRPGLYLTRDEIVKMREHLQNDPRGKKMLARLIAGCDAWIDKEIIFPNPEFPAQLKDRGDAPARAHDMLAKTAGWLGWAWQLTDNPRYAAKAREILVGYAKLYPNDYKEHKGVNGSDSSKIMAQRLSEAMWLLPLIQAYDMVAEAPCMSDVDRTLVETDLIRCAVTFINRKRPAAAEVAQRDRSNAAWRTDPPKIGSGPVGNWMNFYNAAFIQAGIVLGDQNWIDLGAANTKFMLANGIGEDGMWGEGAIGYQLFARHALIGCLEPLARKGVDLYGFMQCRYKNLFDSPLKYAYPDSTAPGINDSGRAPVGGSWTAMAYDYAYLRYGDPNYGAIVNAAPRQVFQSSACYFPTIIYEPLPEHPMAGLGSLIFETLGYAILRGDANGSSAFALMDYGRHGGAHGHPDKLNLILFADGDELAGEPQSYRYEDRRHGEWTRPSIAHWTMSIDQHQQAPTTGKLLAFYDAGDVKVMRGQAAGAYAGVALDRTVVQMPGYFVDVYRAWGQGEHTFDYPLCFRGALDALDGVDPTMLKPMGAETQRGYKHVLTTPPTTTDENWLGIWSRKAAKADPNAAEPDAQRGGPANEVRALVLGAAGSEVYTGVVPGGRRQAVIRRKGSEAVFAAVIDPYLAGDVVKTVETVPVGGPVAAKGLKITRSDGGTDLVIVRYDQQTDGACAAAAAFDGGATDALVAVVRLDADGQVITMGMLGGTTLSVGGKELKLERPGIIFGD